MSAFFAIASRAALAASLLLPAAARASVGEVWDRAAWGADADTLLREFGARAVRLDPPLAFGDGEARVALQAAEIGGHRFVVYFQAGADGGLRRIHFERPRHGAVLGIFRDTINALEAEYGEPTRACDIPRQRGVGNQMTLVRIWQREQGTVRAVFRDTTLGAGEGCLAEDRSGTTACGAVGQLFIQVTREVPPEDCG
jgi:hypothetical protein